MVKKSAAILGILAILALSAAVCSAYTVSKWPAPGVPNVVYQAGGAQLCGPDQLVLKGPVAPSCEPPLVPGVIHAALAIPARVIGLVAVPLFTGQFCPSDDACKVELGEPAYVTAAVPCTPVNAYVPHKGW